MKTIQLDENNNIILSNGNIATIENIDALAQDLRTQLNLNKGENPFNTEQGIDYDNNILGKMGGIDYIKTQFRNRILENQEVASIRQIEVFNNSSNLNINVKINSIYGTLTI